MPDDLRRLPLSMRKANLARLLVGRPDGIFLSPFEQGEIGPDLFRKACEFGAGGLVSKHRDRPYQGGRLGESNHGDFNCHKLFRWKRDVGPKCSIPLLPKHLEVSGDAIHGVGRPARATRCSKSARTRQGSISEKRSLFRQRAGVVLTVSAQPAPCAAAV